jgi:hypothetical protein
MGYVKMRRKDCKYRTVMSNGVIIWSSLPWYDQRGENGPNIAQLYAWSLKPNGTRLIHVPGTGTWNLVKRDEDWEELG